MAERGDPETMVPEFCAMSGASLEQATQYLETHNWDMIAACNSFFQDEDERAAERQAQASAADPDYTGPRTLDGRPAPQTAGRSGRQTAAQPKKKGIATLGSLGGGSHHHDDDEGLDEDEDYDDEDDPNDRGNLFAGGEKSGLAVQDPSKEGGNKKIISDILAKAKANSSRTQSPDEAGPSQPTRFTGTGMTLGGEGVESRSIPDPQGTVRATSGEVQERVLHIWTDGFSIDDGELHRFDDPRNQMDLQMIRSGRAPLHLMNVEHDQPVDVKLHQHDTPYTPQPKKYKPFGGSGQRLGSPVPGVGGSSTPTAATSAPAASSAGGAASDASAPTVDSSQPTIMIRIQLPDGTRLPARFNTTHTLRDVYGFVQGASPETRSRSWVLATTFPNKEHTDQDLVLGEMSEFKKGGTAVVKWT